VLIYLRDGAAGVPAKTVNDTENVAENARVRQWREVGLGAQILRDLGVQSIINLSSSPRAYVGLSGFGIEIADTQALD
jgi:3,4-dihydroxy 2-butanone 4-phosphate synthase / GTP cyclohydrolase II